MGETPKTALAPLKKGDFDDRPPFFKRGDLKAPKITAKHFMATSRYAFGTLRERYQTTSKNPSYSQDYFIRQQLDSRFLQEVGNLRLFSLF